jgi:hypothetical protein
MTDAERQQQRAREFLSLMPLISELAGLPHSEHGRYFTAEQIESRAITLRNAYKVARQMVMEVAAQP